jgi:hypothetical protein
MRNPDKINAAPSDMNDKTELISERDAKPTEPYANPAVMISLVDS